MAAEDDRLRRLVVEASEIPGNASLAKKANKILGRPLTAQERTYIEQVEAGKFEQERADTAKEQGWSSLGTGLPLAIIALFSMGGAISAYLEDAIIFGAVAVFAVLALAWWRYRR
jgi:hypothetical protein